MNTLLIVAGIILASVAALVVIMAGVTRCRNCGRWHECKEIEAECQCRPQERLK